MSRAGCGPPSPSAEGRGKKPAELNTHLTVSKIRGGADVWIAFSAVQLLVNEGVSDPGSRYRCNSRDPDELQL